jgi:hypothetical protein
MKNAIDRRREKRTGKIMIDFVIFYLYNYEDI